MFRLTSELPARARAKVADSRMVTPSSPSWNFDLDQVLFTQLRYLRFMHSDRRELLEQAPSSDARDDALAIAIVAELPRLRRQALYLLYSRVDADDLVQDCLEAALSKKASLQDLAKLRSWLFSILNNLFLMRLRSNARRGQALQIEDFADSLAASVSPEDRDMARDLARAMVKLSVEHRQILLLLNVEEYSYQEVADILEIPIGTVMSRLTRARRRLRALLEGQELQVVD
jgi:RNA polymerase sigma-70 factor, ECF subfamily